MKELSLNPLTILWYQLSRQNQERKERDGRGWVKRRRIKKNTYRKLNHCISLDSLLSIHTATTQSFCLFWGWALFLFLAFLFSETGFLYTALAVLLLTPRPSCPWSQKSYLYLQSAGTEGMHHTPGFSPILSLQTQFITFFFSFLFQRMFGSDHVFFFFHLRKIVTLRGRYNTLKVF